MKRIPLTVIATCLLALLLVAACTDSDPASPDTGNYLPVTEAVQIEGTWQTETMLAAGLPLSNLLVPAATAGASDSRISAFLGDLAVVPSGEYTGVFSAEAQGTARDTAEASPSVSGAHDMGGGFTIFGEGMIQVRLSAENGHAVVNPQNYLGQASILGDTLILEFDFSVPTHKAVPFLPETISFLARMVRQ